jgi:hypothetical protein
MKIQLGLLIGIWIALIGAMLYMGLFVKLDVETGLIYLKHITA